MPKRQVQTYHLLESIAIYALPWACVKNHALSKTHELLTKGKIVFFLLGLILSKFKNANVKTFETRTEDIQLG